ncbi:MAG: succinate dehydrogenase cytochrome b subunit [Bacteroidia bacterium]
MNWITKMFSSSLGQKLIMAITGLFLISFLVVHCTLNSLIFLNDDGVTFNAGAEFMATNPLIRIVEVVLFIGLLLHVVKAFVLIKNNNKSRPVKYAAYDGKANSKWYSRSMGILGSLLLIFLVIHLNHFWVGTKVLQYNGTIVGHNTFHELVEVFHNPLNVLVYLLGVISLGYHLMHGFQSAFQTLGVNHKKYTPFIKSFGNIFSILIAFVFAMMPIAMYFNIIK